MPLLPQDPRDQYRMLGIILLMALGAVFYLYVWSPKSVQLTELEERIEQIEQSNEIAQARTQNLDTIRDELELGERQFESGTRRTFVKAAVSLLEEQRRSGDRALPRDEIQRLAGTAGASSPALMPGETEF